MIGEEKALRGLFTKIAVVLLFLVLFFNIYSAVYVAQDGLVSLFSQFGYDLRTRLGRVSGSRYLSLSYDVFWPGDDRLGLRL